MAQKRRSTSKSSKSKAQSTGSGKTQSKSKAQNSKQAQAIVSQKYQAVAVVLFAAAILLLCLVIIPGASLWGWIHTFILGLFGVCAYFIPLITAYIAFICTLEKPVGSVSGKLFQCVLLMIMLCSAVHVFFSAVSPELGYFSTLGRAYTAGCSVKGGGFFGAVLGYPMERLFTDIGAKIIICLLIFVFLMLITGTTIISLFRAAWKPVKKTKESIEQVIVNNAQRQRAGTIDIDLGDGYMEMPAHPVKSDKKAAALLDIPMDEPTEPVKSEKAEQLEQIALEMQKEEESAPKTDDLLTKNKAKRVVDVPLTPSGSKPAYMNEEADAYRYPPFSLLDTAKPNDTRLADNEQRTNAEILVTTLKDFGVSTKVVDVSRGPSVTRYELEPNAGVKISRITNLADDIALRLATTGVRIEAPIPNKAAVGIEVPNKIASSVSLREMLDSSVFSSAKGKLTVALGKDIAGNIVLADLAKMPHLLIAGTTGSGKSVCTNSMIQSVLFRASPSDVRMLLIDPKQVEFGIYNGIPHLLVPVVTDPRKAAGALGWAVTEMLNRYKIFAENNVRDLASYNELARRSENLHTMPLILIVIDELADLMMAAANEVEDAIIRLAQMARAAGMHLVIATQRPSVDVITGLIKANIPSRLALTVASSVDSRTILDTGGAEKLLGKGDMLFMPVGMPKPMRVQGCFVSNREVESVVDFLKNTQQIEYDESVIEEIDRQAAASGKSSSRASSDDDGEDMSDEMLPQAIEVVVEAGMASTSLLQRKLRLGYARAGRIIDEMERRNIIGPHEGSKPRQVLMTRQQWLEMNMNAEE